MLELRERNGKKHIVSDDELEEMLENQLMDFL